ncbi:MAG: IspD/TarI family cytidylyltransferase [Eubacteriales bacterium]|nr:IspD/TarI family cytidylyltransferase [Eubacteriales bacterium]
MNFVILLCAGESKRFNSSTKKQYTDIKGKALYRYSLDTFLNNEDINNIFIVFDEKNLKFEKEKLLNDNNIVNKNKLHFVIGGSERFYSVYNALKNIEKKVNDGFFQNIKREDIKILIHDSARMFIHNDDINNARVKLKEVKALTLAKKCIDTIKYAKETNGVLEIKKTIDRNNLYAIQTPQCFDYNLIMDIYDKFMKDLKENPKIKYTITDDCILVEKYSNEKVFIIESLHKNDKITFISDL